jgi:putative RNA 2'-phosphotransferase
VPPEFLYHGTATRFLNSILAKGLRSGERNHVHLSADIVTAAAVGQRYGKPVVLKVEALLMHRHDFKFFQADNGVWLTEFVPIEHIICSNQTS